MAAWHSTCIPEQEAPEVGAGRKAFWAKIRDGLSMKRIALAAAAAFLATSPALAATNLVTNGSFESGLSGWIIGGTDNDSPAYPPAAIFYNNASAYPIGAFGEAVPVNNAPTNSPDAAGARAAYFVSDFTINQSLTQQVFLTAGTYQIGFSAYAPQNGFNNAGDATFSGTIAGVTLANYAVSSGPATTWQTFAGAANIASDGLYSVSFVFNTDRFPSKDVVIDQVYIIAGNPPLPAIPEPATWAMLIAGFGLVGAAMRRRQAALA
jgi:hypothetical protein